MCFCYLVFDLHPRGAEVEGAVKLGVGGFGPEREGEIAITSGGRIGRMDSPPPDYRAIAPADWLKATAAYWTSMGL